MVEVELPKTLFHKGNQKTSRKVKNQPFKNSFPNL